MYLLRKVDVLSCAKILGAVHCAISLVFVPVFLLAGFAGALFGNSSDSFSRTGGIILAIALAIIVPLFYGLIGFLFGAAGAWFYNVAAGYLGGIQLEFVAPGVVPISGPTLPHSAQG